MLAFNTLVAFAFSGVGVTSAFETFSSQHLYDWGFYGLNPQQTYKSSQQTAPRFNFLQWDQKCNNGYYFVTPKGRLVDAPGPMIVDGTGSLVWTTDEFGPATGLEVQEYNGKQYLTFWKSLEGINGGWGRGEFVMLDENYEVFRTFRPIGEDLLGDLHEFQVTSTGSVLMTAYEPRPADLTVLGGPAEGWIVDSILQELDIETGALLFEWHAADHVDIEDNILYWPGGDNGMSPLKGFDYFHINSLAKDQNGNYVVSGRHTESIYGIDAKDGEVIWTLGGKKNKFIDLSDGHATDFSYQHHIRLHENNTLSLFDNARAERAGPRSPYDHSRGIVVRLDYDNWTAELIQEFWDPDHPKHADNQGSAQIISDTGGMLVDYGYLPAFTEFDADGKVLCDVRMGPSIMNRIATINSYRAFKGNWVGRPKKHMDVYLNPSNGVLYVSWNGATEVQQWVLQGTDWDTVDTGPWDRLATQPKDGFEAAFEINEDMPKYVRVAAVDKDGTVLKYSAVMNWEHGNLKRVDLLPIILTAVKWSIIGLIQLVLLWFSVVPRSWKKRATSWAHTLIREVVLLTTLRFIICGWWRRRREHKSRYASWRLGKPGEMEPLQYGSDDESSVE